MKSKDALLAAFLIFGFVLIVKALQVAVTDEFWAWLTVAADRLLVSAGVKVLVFAVVSLFCLSLIAASCERSEARRARWEARREAERLEVEAHARSLRVREEIDEATRPDCGRPAA